MKQYALHKYLKADGSFDYEQYKAIQTEGNKQKLTFQSVDKTNIKFLSNYIKKFIRKPKFGLCHGTRSGKEQLWFRKYLNCEVLGTEISDTAEQFPHTIQWDFHNVKPEWIGNVDFIYSNSLDHSYDPKKCLNAWLSCLKPNGLLILEWRTGHSDPATSNPLDPFKAPMEIMPDLIRTWSGNKYYVTETLDAPSKPTAENFYCFLIVRRNNSENGKSELA